ncbi:50S ribosomal protein L28 [Patescibacteria group bacterium]|nr:50S ribosomal protein L28 [Patescibacteria group bacterium]
MSKICEICQRGPRASVSRSHSNVATKTRQLINLQSKKIDGKRISICTKCIKTMSKA